MTVNESWKRIEAWLGANAPAVRKSLRPPGKDDAIDKVVARLGFKLPATFLRSVRVHDGQKPDAEHGLLPGGTWELGALPSCRLLPLVEIAREWTMMKKLLDMGEFAGRRSKPKRGVRKDWWNPRWIPIADNGGGDYLCLDLAPAKGGTRGQVIGFFHDMDDRTLLAKSYAAYLEKLAKGFGSGKYVLDEEEGIVEA